MCRLLRRSFTHVRGIALVRSFHSAMKTSFDVSTEYTHYNDLMHERDDLRVELQQWYDSVNATEDIRSKSTRFARLDNFLYDYNPWSFEGSLYFSATVASTVGYGNFWPETIEGMILLSIFIIPSIIAFIVNLDSVSDCQIV